MCFARLVRRRSQRLPGGRPGRSLVGARGSEVVDVLDVLLNASHHAERDDVEALVAHVVGSMYATSGADMGAMLVRVNS